jgi:hypothetical protein
MPGCCSLSCVAASCAVPIRLVVRHLLLLYEYVHPESSFAAHHRLPHVLQESLPFRITTTALRLRRQLSAAHTLTTAATQTPPGIALPQLQNAAGARAHAWPRPRRPPRGQNRPPSGAHTPRAADPRAADGQGNRRRRHKTVRPYASCATDRTVGGAAGRTRGPPASASHTSKAWPTAPPLT